jgi:Family of unknown function (DUF6152)
MKRPNLLLILALLGASATAQAHHSYAMFDLTRTATIRGTLTAVEWGSPHVWLWVASADGHGTTVTYGFETISPGELVRFCGWKKNSLSIGNTVTLEYVPLRSGRNGGAVKKITLPDGHVLTTQLAQLGRSPGASSPTPGISP